MARHFAELRADRDPIFPGLNRAGMVGLFRELARLSGRESPSCELRLSAVLTSLLAELYAVRATERPTVSLGADARTHSAVVRECIDWFVRRHDRPCLLKQFCAAVGCNRSHFSRLFRRETGVPPIVWLNRYRIEQSKRLLTTTDRPVAEIARAVGISDPNYFARLFRAVTGKTPRALRRE